MMSSSTQLIAVHQTNSCKAIVFSIAHYWFALPVSAVFKIVQCSPSLQHSMQNNDLVLLDDRPLTVINLHHHLQLDSSNIHCLIIVHLDHQSLGAIPVDRSPILQTFSLSEIQPLPFTAHPPQSGMSPSQAIATLASHVALLAQPETTLRVLLLNLQQALAFN